MTEINLPPDWDAERNRSEFLKWTEVLSTLLLTALPIDWAFWQQSRSVQEILAQLARRLGFRFGPIERREETLTAIGEKGDELQKRKYIVATDPHSDSITEYVWWTEIDRGPFHSIFFHGKADTEFGKEVLLRLDRWRGAVKH